MVPLAGCACIRPADAPQNLLLRGFGCRQPHDSVILLPAVLYVAGYLALSRTSSGAIPDHWCRIHRLKWQAEIFKPAAKVESVVTGDEVSTYWMP